METKNRMKEWLDSIASPTTRDLYYGRFRVFLNYINPTVTDTKLSVEGMLELERTVANDLYETRKAQIQNPDTEPEMSRLLKKFYVEMIQGKVKRPSRLMDGKKPKNETRRHIWSYKPKSAFAYANAVRQFFRYFGKAYEVDLTITEQQIKPRVTKKKYVFSPEELEGVLKIAPIRDKTLILLGATSGWGAGDIVQLKKATVEQILSDSKGRYIYFTKRLKTHTDMYLCLTSETRQVLTDYIKTLPVNQTWLFQGYNGEPLEPNRLDYVFKELCAKAGIRSKNPELQPIRFHGLRQFFSRKYRGRPEVKEFCMGHAAPYENAYSLTETEIWEDFASQDEVLRIQQIANPEEVKTLKTQVGELKTRVFEELQPYRKIISEQVIVIEELREQLEALGQKPKVSSRLGELKA